MAKKPATPNGGKQGKNGNPKKKGGKRRKESIFVKIGRKMLGKKAEEVAVKYEAKDPLWFFDEVAGEFKTRLRPLEITDDREWEILKKVRQNAYYLDIACCGCCCACSCCGITFGKSTFIGIFPIAGPIIDVTLGISRVNLKAQKADLPWGMTFMMYVRHGISEGIGLVPFIGDMWIAYYKVNCRNWWVFEKYLIKRARERNRKAGVEY